jgi:hypothetical protein
MEPVIDLNQFRRGLRLFRIILKRFDLEFFLMRNNDGTHAVDEAQILEIVEVIMDWVHRCTDAMPNTSTEKVLHREIQRIIHAKTNEMNLRKPTFL